ncbi:MAG: hypothetical protein KIH01_08040 [Candidatus Freyarchaeota archaeon]|nr:hypothetical protein [Candidatus Jordarchaeia archaeon]
MDGRLDVLVDGSNIVMHATDSEGRGRTETLRRTVQELEEAKLGFFVLFDRGIMRKCDDPSYVKALERRGEGFIVPSRREADAYLLFLAERIYDCFILSRDRFTDYRVIYPSAWRRRITYNVNGDRLEFKPRLEEVKMRRSSAVKLPVELDVECNIGQVKCFLSLVTRRRLEAQLRSSQGMLIERRAKGGRGRISVEARSKRITGGGEGGSGVMLVEVEGIKLLKYRSRSGMTSLTWMPYVLNPSLGRLVGYASPRTLIMLAEAGCINVPSPQKREREVRSKKPLSSGN